MALPLATSVLPALAGGSGLGLSGMSSSSASNSGTFNINTNSSGGVSGQSTGLLWMALAAAATWYLLRGK